MNCRTSFHTRIGGSHQKGSQTKKNGRRSGGDEFKVEVKTYIRTCMQRATTISQTHLEHAQEMQQARQVCPHPRRQLARGRVGLEARSELIAVHSQDALLRVGGRRAGPGWKRKRENDRNGRGEGGRTVSSRVNKNLPPCERVSRRRLEAGFPREPV